MSNEISRHYDNLLSEHYSWMFGDFEAKVTEQKKVLLELLGDRHELELAVDLGSGSGFQSIALGRIGYAQIIAIDTSQALLDELNQRKGNLPVETQFGDIRHMTSMLGTARPNLIVCMGDTLTHLPSEEDVRRLLGDCARMLTPDGVLILTYRDLSTAVSGLDRFIPIRADDHRVMTCVLDYESDRVTVTDLVYARDGVSWNLHKSSYRKLRLPPERIRQWLQGVGLVTTFDGPVDRLHGFCARR